MSAAFGAALMASPIVLWEFWRFITPGLKPTEKRYAIPFLLSSVVLFLMGGAVAWLTFPKALGFLVGIGGGDIGTFFTADKYLTFVSLMIIAFGVSFESEINQSSDQLRVRQARRFPHFRIHADGRKAGDGVGLVDIEFAGGGFEQEVHACHTLAVNRLVAGHGQALDFPGLFRCKIRRQNCF